MITLAWYLLKVIICSGILCGYYFLALRNKAFHRWNRFYLLAAIVISLLAPIIKIDIFQNNDNEGTVVQMLQTISYGDEAVIEYSRSSGFQLNTENLAEGAYLLISIIFLSIFFVSLFKIKRLRKKYPETKIEDISFINTKAKGTPFSFFKSIFWNDAIDLHSRPGQQIFNHEIAHVKEKHSYDKIFMNLVLIFFWINPFFWLMRKELYMIHEFIADKEAMEDSDINAFAEMILQTVYPGQNFSLTNNFFYSPIKRRILMLTKNKNPKVSYISRLLVLPLAAIVFFAFTIKVKNEKPLPLYDGKTITVVIDAGHGGTDNGAKYDNIDEKNITLAIAKQVKELNSNKNINIVLTRDNDEFLSVHDRAKFADEKNANLFISIHLDAEKKENTHSGMGIFIPGNENKYLKQSKLLGSSIVESFKNNYPLKVANELLQRQKGLWLLNENSCPAVLIEAGYLSTKSDRDYLIKNQNQQTIARNILNGIENYAMQNSVVTSIEHPIADTIPPMYYQNKKVTDIEVQSKSNKIKVTAPVIKVTYADGTTEMISKLEADKRGFVLPPAPPPGMPSHYFQSKALFVINGKIATSKEAKSINPDEIKNINILKDGQATSQYGEKGKNGVIEITTKKKDESFTISADTIKISNISPNNYDENMVLKGNAAVFIPDKIPSEILIVVDGKETTKEEMKNIPANIIKSITILKDKSGQLKYGEKGKNGVVEITTKNKNGNIINMNSDAKTINGNSLSEQKDTLPTLKLISKVFTKTEIAVSFPGGQEAWKKYITRQIQASLDSFTNTDFGTCVVRFVVGLDGSVIGVEPTTMKGTHLAKVAVNAIKNGPKWIPAKQNGHDVAAYRLQPVTLQNPDKPKSVQLNLIKLSEPTSSTTARANKEVFLKLEEPKVFLKLEQPASFPGGQRSWLKYITRVFDKTGNELMKDKNNEGTCKVRFIVSKDGKVSDVQATTMKGTQLADVAVNAIRKGPMWIPGKQNGHDVNSYLIVPVTFKLSDNLGIKNEPE